MKKIRSQKEVTWLDGMKTEVDISGESKPKEVLIKNTFKVPKGYDIRQTEFRDIEVHDDKGNRVLPAIQASIDSISRTATLQAKFSRETLAKVKARNAAHLFFMNTIKVPSLTGSNSMIKQSTLEKIERKTVVKHGSYKLLKDTTAKLNGYARPSSIKRTRKRQIEKARRMKHWCQEMLMPIKVGKTFGTIRRENESRI